MRDPDPEQAHPEVAGWVLGTLDPDDAVWFADHLPTCLDCRAAVAEFGPTVRLMATAAPADVAPPELQARTLAGVAREARRNRRWRSWTTRMLTLAAAVVVAAGISIGLLLSGGTPGTSYALALHSGAGLSASASGTVRQAGNGWSVQLTALHLPETGAGQFYQCWWIGPGNGPGHARLISAGTFTVGSSGTATVQMSTAANPDDFSTVEITLASAAQPGQLGRVVLSGTIADAD